MRESAQAECRLPAEKGAAAKPKSTRKIILLCLPTLLGVVAFAFSFPIGRHVPFLRSVSIAEVWEVWWLPVAPICTLVAYVMLMRGTWKARLPGKAMALAWTVLLVTCVLNLIMVTWVFSLSY